MSPIRRHEYRYFRLIEEDPFPVAARILRRAYDDGIRSVVCLGNADLVEHWVELLWRKNGFLPHGSRLDMAPENQPIYLTDHPENPAGATTLLLAQDAVFFRQESMAKDLAKDFTKVIRFASTQEEENAQQAYNVEEKSMHEAGFRCVLVEQIAKEQGFAWKETVLYE